MRKTLLWDNERGATLVLMAITIVLTLSMAAVAIDYGRMKSARAEAQRATDAAALAGASAYQEAGTPAAQNTAAVARVQAWIVKNSVAGKQILIGQLDSVKPDAVKQRVDVWFTSAPVKTWFANTFGTTSMALKSHSAAVAAIGGVITNCLKPFLLPDMWQETSVGAGHQDANSNRMIDGPANNPEIWNYEPGGAGTDRYLKYDPNVTDNPLNPQTGYGSKYRNSALYPDDKGLPMLMKPMLGSNESRHGNWYYLLDGPQKNVRSDIESGCINASVGETPTFAPGGKTGQVRKGVQTLYDQDPTALWDQTNHKVVSSYGEASPRVIIVGLFDPWYIKGTAKNDKPDAGMTFTNFAKVFIDTRPNGNDDISVKFVGFVPGGNNGGTSGTLLKVLRLVE
ncbi:MAG: pilus assembly protein TadG-related protein [Gemmatimonadales bacterium]